MKIKCLVTSYAFRYLLNYYYLLLVLAFSVFANYDVARPTIKAFTNTPKFNVLRLKEARTIRFLSHQIASTFDAYII